MCRGCILFCFHHPLPLSLSHIPTHRGPFSQCLVVFHRDHVKAVLSSTTEREELPVISKHDQAFFGRGIINLHGEGGSYE